jgi:choline dehydrogenase
LLIAPKKGKYLQDHVEGVINVNASAPWENDPNTRCDPTLGISDPCLVEWQQDGTGPYGEAAAPLGLVYNTSVSETSAPDLFYYGLVSAMTRGFYPGFSSLSPTPLAWTWNIVKMHKPGDGDYAQGAVTLRSSDPREVPDIVFDWLQGDIGERDVTALVEGTELINRGFENLEAPIGPITRAIPAEGEDIRQNLRDEAFGHHASSSCRIGPKDNTEYCVDSEFRVNGVQGLRVVDASIFPHTPGGFPVILVYMIGLKAADVISEAAK